MTEETRELTDPEKVMRLKAFVAIYDRAMLEKSSRDWFEGIAGEVEALPLEASPEETQRLFSQVMRAYVPLSMAHLSEAANRLDKWKLDQGPSGEVVALWTFWGLNDFMDRHTDEWLARMAREGIDPTTEQPLPPGWLELEIPEVEAAYYAARGWPHRAKASQE